MVPVNDYHTGHPRLAQLTHSSTSNSLSSLQNSPSTSRSTRNLGAIGGRSGPGYSPYARRVSRAAAAAREEEEFEDDATIRGEGESEVGDSPVQQRSGLFGRVKSLPGKALGWLTRSSSSKTLSSSTSLADVRAAVEEEQAKEQGNGIGRGMQRSKTANNLARAADSPSAPSALPSRLRSRQPQKDSLPSSSSMSALSSIGSPFAPSGLRSSHSTLNLASASTNGSGVPSFLTTSNLSRHSRAVSPALSSASYAHSRRSPSPMRNGLAGSMSAFNLAQPRSPTSAFGGAHDTTTLGNAAMTSGSNPFGLTSRSPFAPGGGGRSGSQRAVSVAGSHRSSSTRPEGHALFPYTSTIPRGASPSIAGSQSMREGLSSFASAPSPHPTSAPSTAQKRPYARVGSPLNPRAPFSPTEGEGSQTGGAERARKKQMVWDPARGLVSRERLDMEKERDAPPLPKNEAERILEVLEGMGRTPLGEAKRGAARPKKISVPAPVSPGDNSRLARSSNGPSAAPYAARQAPSNSAASSGKGLQSVLRAREERRRALVEQEREERERERKEKEERDRRRDERRRELERLEREADEEDELESVMSQDYDDEEDRPRRRTRSSAAAPKSKKLEPPTPRRSTRASARNAKSPSPLPTPKKKGKSKRVQQDDEEETKDAELELPSTRQKRTISKSPAPPSEASERMHSGSPPPPPKIVFPPPAVPSTSANPTQRSSLRPGKSHSSRQHTASSKVFSAREEDLPPIDDDALSKIQMPAMKFPSSFSFGAPAPSKPAESGTTSPPADSEKKEEGSSLLSRLSAAPVPSSDKPAFSFGTSAPSTSTIPPLPAISFGAASSKPAPSSSLFKPTPPAADLFAPKPSAPSTSPSSGFSFATSSTSTPAVPKATLPASSDGAKPNFFGSIIAEKKEETPKAAPLPSFTFGSTSSTPAIKSTEGASELEKEKKDVQASNPFAAFGKPVSEIIKESNEGKTGGEDSLPVEKKDEVAKPMFSFGAASTAEPAEKTESAPAASPFAFKPTPSTSASSAPSFSFGASKPVDETTKPASTSSFSFGSTPSVPPTTSTPKATFTFGTTPATPTAEEKASTPIPSAPPSPFGALAPPGPASVAGTDDADGDSGMEDEAEPASSTSKPNTASPAPFSFGSAAPSSSTSTGLFGASPSSSSTTTGFTFGSSAPSGDKKESAPSPFGAPSTTSTNSLFGGPSSTSAAKPFTFGSPSPSPAPQSPAAAAPSTTSFSFGQPSTSAAPASSPFTFGATAPSNPSPFDNPSSRPASPAPASTGFSFGAASSNPPASPSAPFAFGSQPASNKSTSSAMGQTLSAPGTNGAASPFGAPSTSSFAFGNSASQPVSPSASTSTPSFNFGGPQAAPPSFSFGASTSGAAPPASPFGAPSNTAPAAGGFSFGAPTGSGATTPTGGGLFNLGSGGEDAAGKSGRPIRPLRRRK